MQSSKSTGTKVTLQSVTFVGTVPVFTGTDTTGCRRTFTGSPSLSPAQAQAMLNKTIIFQTE